jgi:hypothetical protein
LSSFTPCFFIRRLAFGAMAVPAAVIQVPLKAALRAPLAMSTEYCGSAVHDLLHHLAMPPWNIVRLKIRLAIFAKNVRHL